MIAEKEARDPHLEPQAQLKENKLGVVFCVENSRSTSNGILPPVRLHLLNLPKLQYPLGITNQLPEIMVRAWGHGILITSLWPRTCYVAQLPTTPAYSPASAS